MTRPAVTSVLRSRRGASIVEFAFVAPVYLLFLFSLFALGLTTMYQHFLDDAVRDAARQVQMATAASASPSGFVNAVCSRFAVLDSACATNITYVVQASSPTAGFAGLSPQALSPSGTYPNAFFAGSPFVSKAPVMVQVAYAMPFTFPFVGTLATGTNTGSITASTTVRAEPF